MQISRGESIRLMLTTISLALAVWYLVTRFVSVPGIILPAPSKVIEQVRDGPDARIWLRDVLYSTGRVVAGFCVAAALAVPVGLYAGYYGRIEALTAPIIEAGRYIPVPALIPLTILWIGIDESQKVTIIFLGTFFPLVAAISDLAKGVDRQLIDVGRTLGQSDASILWRIVAPAISASVFDIFRIGIGWAWSYLVVAEIISAGVGIGYRIMASQRYLQVGLVFAGILLLGTLGLVTDYLFRAIRKVAFRWNY